MSGIDPQVLKFFKTLSKNNRRMLVIEFFITKTKYNVENHSVYAGMLVRAVKLVMLWIAIVEIVSVLFQNFVTN